MGCLIELGLIWWVLGQYIVLPLCKERGSQEEDVNVSVDVDVFRSRGRDEQSAFQSRFSLVGKSAVDATLGREEGGSLQETMKLFRN